MIDSYMSVMKRLNNTGPKTEQWGDSLRQWQSIAGRARDPHPLPPARQV